MAITAVQLNTVIPTSGASIRAATISTTMAAAETITMATA